MTTVNQQPWRIPLVDPGTGLLAVPWQRFLLDIYNRAGGRSALTNTELNTAIERVIAGEMVIQGRAAEAVCELLMQQAGQADQFADVTQTPVCADNFEMIFQG